MGPKTQAAMAKYNTPAPSYASLTTPEQAQQGFSTIPGPFSALTGKLNPTQAPAPASSMTDILTKILTDYQKGNTAQYTGNNTALLAGKQAINQTNSDVYSADLANANISNEARMNLLNQAPNIQNPGLNSITDQQSNNLAKFNSYNKLIEDTAKMYNDSQESKKPSDLYGTGIIGEYNFAKSQGYKGTFIQYQNEDANRKFKATGGGSTPKAVKGQVRIEANQDPGTIANQYGITLSELKNLNLQIKDWKAVRPGTVIYIPIYAPKAGKKDSATTALLKEYGFTAEEIEAMGIE